MFKSLGTKISFVVCVLGVLSLGLVGLAYTYKFVSLYGELRENPYEQTLWHTKQHMERWLLAGTPIEEIPNVNQYLRAQLAESLSITSFDISTLDGVVVFSSDKSFLGDPVSFLDADKAAFDQVPVDAIASVSSDSSAILRIGLVNDLNIRVGILHLSYARTDVLSVERRLLTALVLILIILSPLLCSLIFITTRHVMKGARFEEWLPREGKEGHYFAHVDQAEGDIIVAREHLNEIRANHELR
ncbi:MAG: hypothetical protein K0U36_06785 [Alphaproteobacteria bacterium]|nr:hypothetical protein [Alphaproteobacteria bacterium]